MSVTARARRPCQMAAGGVAVRPLLGATAGDVLVKEHDALTYALQQFGVGARLEYPRGRILDQGPEAYIVVQPPPGVSRLPAASSARQIRRLHDHKTLTPRGVQALAGPIRGTRGSGLLGSGAVVWQMEVKSVTAGCTLVYTSTIAQVAAGDVRVHERPAPLYRLPPAGHEATGASMLAAASAEFARMDDLKAKRMELALLKRHHEERAAADDASSPTTTATGTTTALLPSTAATVDAAASTLDAKIHGAERSAAQMRRAGNANEFTREHRDRIHTLTSEGHPASKVSQIMIAEAAAGGALHAPPLGYIQGVQDTWRRQARETCQPYGPGLTRAVKRP